MSINSKSLITVKNLEVAFPVYGGILRYKVAEVRAVDNISFTLYQGETLGLVGESGSGKTTVGRAIANLLRTTSPDVQLRGNILLHRNGTTVDLNGLPRRNMQSYRSVVQMMFQDPYSSLNPRMTVQEILERPLKLQTHLNRLERTKRILQVLDSVGLQADTIGRYPHEFSGGQRQRIGIARALAMRPKIIIADEPVSALDVSVQAQVINLMEELQAAYGLTYLFIAHDISLVYHISDRIAVMYLGNIVELGKSSSIYQDPQHPYTRALLSAVPKPDPQSDRSRRICLKGDVPTPLNKPTGCSFHSRCPIAQSDCSVHVPDLIRRKDGRSIACPHT